MKIILSLLVLVLPAAANAAVYKYVDEKGNIIFSDRQQEGAEEQTLSKPSIVPAPPPLKPPAGKEVERNPGVGHQLKAPVENYSELRIVSPKSDQTVRDNAGEVNIVVEATPQLSAESGHVYIAYLDGKKLKTTWSSSSFQLQNVDRGTHRVKIAIKDKKSGKILIRSGETTFHLQRFSAIRGN